MRLAADEGGQDPLIASLAAARRGRDHNDALIRRLLAYGREFVQPRPYPLTDLAEAAGFKSASGVRTAYNHPDVEAVAAATGAKPREWRAADAETQTLEDMIADLRGRCARPDAVTELFDVLQAHGWTPAPPGARHGGRSTRRYIVWRRNWPNGTTVTLYQESNSIGTGNNVAIEDARRLYFRYPDVSVAEATKQLTQLVQRVNDHDAADGRK